MKDFFKSWACKSRVHCKACRNDRAFRESLARTFRVPSIDFDCPFNKILKSRETICQECLDKLCPIKIMLVASTGCKQRKAVLRMIQTGRCPKDKWNGTNS